MPTVETTVSNLIEGQFPEVYRSDGPTFVAFVLAYYEWLESQGQPLNVSRSLLSYSDIDTTLDQFISYFTSTYLSGVQFNIKSDKRLAVKHALDLYRAKGSTRAVKLLFQLVFGKDVSIYLPSTDILKSSDGVWTTPYYLEVTPSPRNSEYVGQLVTGITSGATAFVDHIVVKRIGGRYVHLFYITNLSNTDFQTGELLGVNSDLSNVPLVTGSLTSLTVENGGYGFAVGDIVSLRSLYGSEGTGIVRSIVDVTGLVNFSLVDGGWGYSNAYANVLISNTVLTIGGIQSTSLQNSYPILEFGTIQIGTANILTNGSVDTNSGWVLGPTAIRVGNTIAPNGTDTAVVYTGNASSPGNQFAEFPISLVPGETYTASIWAKLISGSTPTTGKLLNINNGSYVSITGVTTSWQQFTLTFVAGPADGTSANNNVFYAWSDFGPSADIAFWGAEIHAGSSAYTGPSANVFAFSSNSSATVLSQSGDLSVGEYLLVDGQQTNTSVLNVSTSPGYFVTIANSSALLSYNETVYQSNGTANTFVGGVLFSNTTTSAYLYTVTGQLTTGQLALLQSNTFVDISSKSYIQFTDLTLRGDDNSYIPILSTVTGNTSGAQSQVLAYQTQIGLTSLSGAITANDVVFSSNSAGSFVNGYVLGFTSGNFANIALGSVLTTEEIFFNPPYLYENSTSNTPYLSLPLSSNAYGFPAVPIANLTTGYLFDVFPTELLEVGTITAIVTTNPGTGYTGSPYVRIYEDGVFPKRKHDYVITVSNVSGQFLQSEEVTQNVAVANTLELVLPGNVAFLNGESIYQVNTAVTGTFTADTTTSTLLASNTTVNALATFSNGEQLLIGGKDIRTVLTVINSTAVQLNSAPYTANTSAEVEILGATGQILDIVTPAKNVFFFSNTSGYAWLTTANVYGLSSGVTSTITEILPQAYVTALGQFVSESNNVLQVNRWSIASSFSVTGSPSGNVGGQLVGSLSGATADIVQVSANTYSQPVGFNAVISANVVTSNGSVSSMDVQSSGVGYISGETVSFVNPKNGVVGTAVTNLGKQGKGQGFYSSTKGFLSDDKYIQDGFFYQLFSYEVRSSLDPSEYYTIVKDVVHMAGTALYGAVIKTGTAQTNNVITSYEAGPIIG